MGTSSDKTPQTKLTRCSQRCTVMYSTGPRVVGAAVHFDAFEAPIGEASEMLIVVKIKR